MLRSGRLPALRSLVLGLATTLILAACGSEPAASEPVPPSGAVAIVATEYKFTPDRVTVPAGEVRFWVRNAGSTEHEFELFKGDQVVDELEGLVPGLFKELPVTLAAGEYTFVCKLSGHDQLGMKGTLTVTGG